MRWLAKCGDCGFESWQPGERAAQRLIEEHSIESDHEQGVVLSEEYLRSLQARAHKPSV